MKAGLLFNPGALWIGAHWLAFKRRWCINLLPCVTLWIALQDGGRPERATRKKIRRCPGMREHLKPTPPP
jgi:hypothetical protein